MELPRFAVLKVGTEGRIVRDRETWFWFALSKRPTLTTWMARRSSLHTAERALMDAHRGRVEAGDFFTPGDPIRQRIADAAHL